MIEIGETVPGSYDPSKSKIYERFDEEKDHIASVFSYLPLNVALVGYDDKCSMGSIASFAGWNEETKSPMFNLPEAETGKDQCVREIFIISGNFEREKLTTLFHTDYLNRIAPSLTEFCNLLTEKDPENKFRMELLIDDIYDFESNTPILYLRLGTPIDLGGYQYNQVPTEDNPAPEGSKEDMCMVERSKLYALHLKDGQVYEHDGLGNYALQDPEIWINYGHITSYPVEIPTSSHLEAETQVIETDQREISS